jgi:hypothetical protein
VDLRDQCGVDEPRDIEQAFVVPIWVRLMQHVADGVVLTHENGVQHAEADPPVPQESGFLHTRAGVNRQSAIGVQSHLA